MSRAHTDYAQARAAQRFEGLDVEKPEPGFYKFKLSRDTVLRAVQLWYGPPADPETGEIMDRSWRWQARMDDGELIEFDRCWPQCARDPITEAEFKRCKARTDWAREHAADSAYAERGVKIDLLSRSHPLPF